MKKLISILLLITLILIACAGCDQKPPQELRDLPGYTITYIRQDYQSVYGYIKNEELELCTKNKIDKIKVLYPYRDVHEEEFVVVEVDSIRKIVVGEKLTGFN